MMPTSVKSAYPKFLPALAVAFALMLAPNAFAESVVKPVPVPDLSKLSAPKADELRQARVEFEKVKPTLAGERLAEAHALLGAAYSRAGFYDAAAIALEDASALEPNDGRWVYAQGIIARLQNQNQVALGYFERALQLDQGYLPIRMAVVNARIEQNDLEGARKLLQDFTTSDVKNPLPYAMLGELALRQKRYPDAIAQTKRALEIDPNATKLYTQLADAYQGAGDAKNAADARAKVGDGMPALGDPIGLGLIQAQAPAPANPPASNAAQQPAAPGVDPAVARTLTPEREADFLLQTRQYDIARQKLDSLLRSRPNDPDLLALYARVEAADGNLPQARSRAQAAVSANPNAPSAHRALGYVLEMMNDDRGAQAEYEKVASLDPKASEASVDAGNILMRNGRYDDAATRYRAAIAADGKNGEAWTRLVAAEAFGGKCETAIRDINGALAKDARNGILMQLFVRVTSTCPASGAPEKKMALDYGGKIYQQSDAAPIAEAYALALAANGKWDDAVKTQQAAMFVLVRNNRRHDVPAYRDFLQQFQAHKLPDKPWSPMSDIAKPAKPTAPAK
ncbi:MAG: tetratricopeptide repeat protein [Rhodanobacteraceae bacterium]